MSSSNGVDSLLLLSAFQVYSTSYNWWYIHTAAMRYLRTEFVL